MIFILGSTLACGFIITVPRVIIPLSIAYVLSLILRPFVNNLYSQGIARKSLTIFVFLLMLAGVSYPLVTGLRSISAEASKIEYYIPKLDRYLREKNLHLSTYVQEKFNYSLSVNYVDSLTNYAEVTTQSILKYLPSAIGAILEFGFIIPFFLFFLLKDGRKIRFQFLRFVPNSFVERFYYLSYQFNIKFGNYVFAKFIEASIITVVITVGLLIIGYPFAFLLGLFAGFTNILPYLGPFLGFIPALIIGLVDNNGDITMGAMTLLYVTANIIDLAFVFPLLVSKVVNLHPIAVVLSVIIGSHYWGILGMVVSIPLAAFLKILIEELYMGSNRN